MAMEIREFREWNHLSELLANIPLRVQRNLFPQNLSITCVQVVDEFVAIGSDAGIVFWFNRSTGDMQRLQAEASSSVTCLHVVSSVEFMVACGSACGQINVFQIQKKAPADLNLDIPLTRTRPIERYTIKNMHQRSVQCIHWSKNGMRLFTGDHSGSVVMTEFDFQLHISKSAEILNESYEIVQMDFRQPWLLVSTIYRSIICERQSNGEWKVSQIGKKDRKVLSDFGVSFIGSARTFSVLCVRPGFRIWISDTSGNVLKTLLFKDSMSRINHSAFEIPLLNPGQPHVKPPLNFGLCHMLDDNIVVTCSSDCILFLHLEQQKVVAAVRRLRSIRNVCVRNGEIFVVEGVRNIIRISHASQLGYAESAFPTSLSDLQEFHDVDETMAEECFELPPIEAIVLDIPIKSSLDEHDLLLQDKLFLEHSRRVEVFEKINDTSFDESILFKQSTTKKKAVVPRVKRFVPSGIVEIGHQVVLPEEQVKVDSVISATGNSSSETSRPLVVEASVCTTKDGSSIRSIITSDPTTTNNYSTSTLKNPSIVPAYPPMTFDDQQSMAFQHTTPLKKLYFIEDNDHPLRHNEKQMPNAIPVLATTLTDTTSTTGSLDSAQPNTSSVPDIRHVASDYMNIPNLWNVEIECADDTFAEPIVDIDERDLSSLNSDTSFEIVDL